MRWSFWLLIIGGVLVYFGVQEFRLRGAAKAEPQLITCAELAENGPGDNAHVIMSDFLLVVLAYVYEGKTDGPWSKVWVPAVPLGGHYHQGLLDKMDADGNIEGPIAMPAYIPEIVKSTKARYQYDVDDLSKQNTVQGLIINSVETLKDEEMKLLKENYPSVDFDECWILEVDRKPASLVKVAGFGGGGIALLALSAAMMLRGRAAKSQPVT